MESRERLEVKVASSMSDGETAAVAENALYDNLLSQYDILPVDRFSNKTKPAREVISARLTPDVLVKAANLENPKIYGVNVQGELLIGDGGSEVPAETLGQNYFQARRSIQAKGLSFMRSDEYRFFNRGEFENKTMTFLESGTSSLALIASWHDWVYVRTFNSEFNHPDIGARRVLRIKI